MLRIIFGLPTRTASIAIQLAGTLPFRLMLYKAHLSFLHRILSMSDDAVSKAVL